MPRGGKRSTSFKPGQSGNLRAGIVTPASGLPFSQQPSSQANEENELQRVSFPA